MKTAVYADLTYRGKMNRQDGEDWAIVHIGTSHAQLTGGRG